ncbi:hypothetical protein [Bacillus sp. UNCCL81]|uniref:hypothetical protein n=1 Tax=Bacillus sp. UNCCL81 TaxID=1502755 RepID=UPI0008E56A4F|nr:hypothetical protein [Bacillus sp. UNCCL81]SFD61832.1 hypothetical protein SAMN02799633_04306 [Bacillus sp. UNCCL81]
MKLIKYILIIFISLLSLNHHSYATKKTTTEEKFYNTLQYGKFESALHKFETENNIKISTPKKFPFEVTHKFGKINDGTGYNRFLDLYYYNENTKEWITTIIINGNREIQKIPTDQNIKVDNLNVMYRKRNDGNLTAQIEFHKENLTYVILVSNKVNNFQKNDVVNIVKSIK